jgi:hypothetical protein
MGRLYLAAVRLVGSADRVIDCGISSAKDLVSEVIKEFLRLSEWMRLGRHGGRADAFVVPYGRDAVH